MMEPWFTPETERLFSMLLLLAFTATLEPLARQGRARAAVMTTFASCIGLGLALLALAAVAAESGQPGHVVRPLTIGGLVVTLLFATAFEEMRRIYNQVELRKTMASDLQRQATSQLSFGWQPD
jgi:hypothetical protein